MSYCAYRRRDPLLIHIHGTRSFSWAVVERNFALHQTKVRVQRRSIPIGDDCPDRRYHCHPSAVRPVIGQPLMTGRAQQQLALTLASTVGN